MAPIDKRLPSSVYISASSDVCKVEVREDFHNQFGRKICNAHSRVGTPFVGFRGTYQQLFRSAWLPSFFSGDSLPWSETEPAVRLTFGVSQCAAPAERLGLIISIPVNNELTRTKMIAWIVN